MKIGFIGIVFIAIIIVWYWFKPAKDSFKASEANVLFTLSKKRSFGKTQVFNLIGFDNGVMEYSGSRNVDLLGLYQTKLNMAQLADIKSLFDENEFHTLEPKYLTNLKDLQKIEIRYQNKRVLLHKRRAPENLKHILATLEELIKNTKWEKSIPK